MLITFEELRKIKHNLPTGSVSKIAEQLELPEQTVRNYFGAKKYSEGGKVVDLHVQPGPNGGVIEIDNPQIIELAKQMISEQNTVMLNDKETLKVVLLELLKEDREFCRAVAKEIAVEGQAILNEEAKREEELKTSIHKIFDKYDDVFKALA